MHAMSHIPASSPIELPWSQRDAESGSSNMWDPHCHLTIHSTSWYFHTQCFWLHCSSTSKDLVSSPRHFRALIIFTKTVSFLRGENSGTAWCWPTCHSSRMSRDPRCLWPKRRSRSPRNKRWGPQNQWWALWDGMVLFLCIEASWGWSRSWPGTGCCEELENCSEKHPN